MGFFDFRKKNVPVSCNADQPAATIHDIKVLGAGCQSCHDQLGYVKSAVSKLGISVEIEYITAMEQVIGYGVMTLPAIVINGQVITSGKVLKTAAVEALLQRFHP